MSDLRRLLIESATRMGVSPSDDQCLSVLKYIIILNKWNQRINLTGTRDDREILGLHVLDSLAVVPHIPADASSLIDVGSGAGLPGAVIAIFRPDLHIIALEPIRKKQAFLSSLRRELGLSQFQPLARRVEEHRDRPEFSPVDAAVSRATWPVDEWLEIGATLVRDGGVVLGMEGASPRHLPAEASRHPYDIEDRTRSVVVYRPARVDGST
ncbi:MAG TPA: 16S rRNA (guanine(527)-N(7))-methyltransferase RsmG [Kofleriaceae bacterium]|nr:16S rRNA (guanine(527)-N(7))-methyltransferase RsmG [Kofleriaceae bacterium]